MTILLIASQDLRKATFGLWKDGCLVEEQSEIITPEQLLFTLDTCLKRWGVVLEDLRGIGVVSGPGSFTSARISVTVANSMAFALRVPVVDLPNPERLPLVALLTGLEQRIKDQPVDRPVYPLYDRPPHITSPTLSPHT